jgi:AraC family L-rhamnose operon transcriptional activator RhaR/AraC family L-rhamnose operon regulatory protein RhaS
MKVYKTEELIEKGKSLHIFSGTRQDKPEPVHIHDFIELIYVRSGEAEECVDGVSYRVRHGDMVFINYGSTHTFTPCGEYAYINICFSPEVVGDAIVTAENAFSLLSLTAFNEMRSESGGGIVSFFGGERREIEEILSAMLREYRDKPTAWGTVTENYLNILITKMLRKTQRGIDSEEMDGMWRSLSEYIDQNLNAELTLSALAQKCFYNPSYFSRVFKDKFRMSPVEYITRKRLDRAVLLLCESGFSVDEISERAGFSDRRAFYHAFSKYIGGSPSDYRRGKSKK